MLTAYLTFSGFVCAFAVTRGLLIARRRAARRRMRLSASERVLA
ncbi:hypothetical protein [Cognatilysobacter bugurensis]|nr:hypothetical protein [Lysobacter bugurensis]